MTLKNEIATLKISLNHCKSVLEYAKTKARIEEKVDATYILLDRGMISFDECLDIVNTAF